MLSWLLAKEALLGAGQEQEVLMVVGEPVGVVCEKCGTMVASLLNVKKLDFEGRSLRAICSACISRLSKEKGITPDSPENWNKLVED